jgi:hypothetical protein
VVGLVGRRRLEVDAQAHCFVQHLRLTPDSRRRRGIDSMSIRVEKGSCRTRTATIRSRRLNFFAKSVDVPAPIWFRNLVRE